MKRLIILGLLITLIAGAGASSAQTVSDTSPEAYMTFAINVHDWMNLGNSAESILSLVTLFESWNVRGDFYLTAPMTRFYAGQYPEVLERLCDSDMTISYHVRPPHPLYSGFDGSLRELEGQGLYDAIYAAETLRLDLSAGELIPAEVGGYLYVAQQCGRNPVALGLPNGNPAIRTAASEVYANLGAQMVIMEHETGAQLRLVDGLWTRPSDFSVTRWDIDDGHGEAFWWNMLDKPVADQYDPLVYLQTQLEEWSLSQDRPAHVTMLIHENNFTRRAATPWALVYYTDRNKTEPLSPPFDLNVSDASLPRSTENQEAIWGAYSAVVAYAASSPSIEVVTSEDIVRLAEVSQSEN